MTTTLSVLAGLGRIILPLRRWEYDKLKAFSSAIKGKRIIEIGTGGYDVADFFDKSNEIVRTDIDPKHGLKVVDIVSWNEKDAYDIVLCLNVLEHVYEIETAVKNIHNALRPGGKVFIAVPGFYPLHLLPHDYWRFTEFSLTKILSGFENVKVTRMGLRRLPFGYVAVAEKGGKL
jgi:SAM-dependent methyltransferase